MYKCLANLVALDVNKTESASHFIDNRSAGYNLFTVYEWSIVPHDINRPAGFLRSFSPIFASCMSSRFCIHAFPTPS